MPQLKSNPAWMGCMILIILIGCKKEKPEEKIPEEKKWMVTTIAGDGTASFTNGPTASSSFHFPNDVAVTSDGIIYVTDLQNHCIRKIDNGQVSTFAGGSFGIENGQGLLAKFKHPLSITLDALGNIYTTDVSDPRIRKINPAAEVLTYTGNDEEGFADGKADTARFGEEAGIVADALGNIYIADAQNNRIRKISVSGNVSTIAGGDSAGFRDGEGAKALFNFPSGIAIDQQGNLYVADGLNFRIRKITPAGLVSTIAGGELEGSTDGDTGIASFQYPSDIVIDREGNLYVLDISRIRKVSKQGVVSTIAGSTDGYVDGEGASAKFYTPDGIGIDMNGNIYVADTNNNRIRKISAE